MVDAKARMEEGKMNAKETKTQIDEFLSWAECFDAANIETKHMIVARLIDRVEVSHGYKNKEAKKHHIVATLCKPVLVNS